MSQVSESLSQEGTIPAVMIVNTDCNAYGSTEAPAASVQGTEEPAMDEKKRELFRSNVSIGLLSVDM